MRGPTQMSGLPERQIRARFDQRTIRVYQAYSAEIAVKAVERQTFASPPFKMDRMTWIKPSFLWMMYRSGWGEKDPGQAHILAIDISRSGFEWALAHGCESRPPDGASAEDWAALKARSPVRIQWDPERDLDLQPLAHRAIQIGLGGEAVRLYVSDWIERITEVTDLARRIKSLRDEGRRDEALALLPREEPYPSDFIWGSSIERDRIGHG